MEYFNNDIAKQVGCLALRCSEESFDEIYDAVCGGIVMWRHFEMKELLTSFMLNQKGTKDGLHINVMKNGDVFAREYPYYDGVLDNLVAVKNQRKIFELIQEAIEKKLENKS